MLDILQVLVTTASVVSVMGFLLYTFLDWFNRYQKNREQKIFTGLVKDLMLDNEVVQLMSESMKKDINQNQREVLKRTILRTSQLSLVDALRIDTERKYLFKALIKPDVYPWEDE